MTAFNYKYVEKYSKIELPLQVFLFASGRDVFTLKYMIL